MDDIILLRGASDPKTLQCVTLKRVSFEGLAEKVILHTFCTSQKTSLHTFSWLHPTASPISLQRFCVFCHMSTRRHFRNQHPKQVQEQSPPHTQHIILQHTHQLEYTHSWHIVLTPTHGPTNTHTHTDKHTPTCTHSYFFKTFFQTLLFCCSFACFMIHSLN